MPAAGWLSGAQWWGEWAGPQTREDTEGAVGTVRGTVEPRSCSLVGAGPPTASMSETLTQGHTGQGCLEAAGQQLGGTHRWGENSCWPPEGQELGTRPEPGSLRAGTPRPAHLVLALGIHQAGLQHVQGLAQDRGTPALGGGAHHQRACHVRCLGAPQPPQAYSGLGGDRGLQGALTSLAWAWHPQSEGGIQHLRPTWHLQR